MSSFVHYDSYLASTLLMSGSVGLRAFFLLGRLFCAGCPSSACMQEVQVWIWEAPNTCSALKAQTITSGEERFAHLIKAREPGLQLSSLRQTLPELPVPVHFFGVERKLFILPVLSVVCAGLGVRKALQAEAHRTARLH